MKTNKVAGGLLGVAVGDALGVPYEFMSRLELKEKPAIDMVGFGTHMQPKGTWSDDSSLTFCLGQSLIGGYDLKDIASKFIDWKYSNYWTARGDLFDIGLTTSKAISRLKAIFDLNRVEELETQKYLGDEFDNGNGSLMRILPLLFYIKGKDITEQFDIIWNVSALTHRHIRAAMSCMIYLRIGEHLLNGVDKETSYLKMRNEVLEFWRKNDISRKEQMLFKRIVQEDIRQLKESEIKSGGYVIESLEASVWCFLTKGSYKEVVLSAVNLGDDTDTTAAIAGGLAGLYYGLLNIPEEWVALLPKLKEILILSDELNKRYLITQ